jgi:SAM-dependent methyltransferase
MGFLIVISIVLFVLLLDLLVLAVRLFEAMLPSLFRGAIYAPSREERIEKMIKLSGIKLGEKAVDLGAGDGRLVIALARAGTLAQGFEIDPFLVLLARRNIRRAGLADKAFVYWKNFWQTDLSQFDIVAVYGLNSIMKRLEAKLKGELKAGARVVSNYFTFPDWPEAKSEGSVHLYVR